METNRTKASTTAPIIKANIALSLLIAREAACAASAAELSLPFQGETHPAGMDEAGDGLESAAGRIIAVPVRRGLGLVSHVARHRSAAGCPRERQFPPKRRHSGKARTPDRNCTPRRMVT